MNKLKKDFIGKVFITNNSKATKTLGRNFAKSLRVGDIICLYGDLGSGKTTFVQGLAEGIGVKEKIISPTFIIIRAYPSKNFYHIDLYRIENDHIKGLGLEEILEDPFSITAIEWAQNLKSLMPEKRIDVKFSYSGENKRKVTFTLGF